MDWIDYRKKLGLGFQDKDKTDLFIKRIGVYMKSAEIPFEEQDETSFCYMIGEDYFIAGIDIIEISYVNDPIGLHRAWLYLEKRTKSFEDFLSCVVALVNTYTGKKTDKKAILTNIKKALKDSHIEFELIEDEDGVFIFPKGAKELDNALISEPLEWLKKYSDTHKIFVKALKAYSNITEENASDVADLFRKALETFFQEFFGGSRSLEKYVEDRTYEKYLDVQGVPSDLRGEFENTVKMYSKFINNNAKHHDKTSKNILEYVMYQTGNIIRLLITLEQEETENAD